MAKKIMIADGDPVITKYRIGLFLSLPFQRHLLFKAFNQRVLIATRNLKCYEIYKKWSAPCSPVIKPFNDGQLNLKAAALWCRNVAIILILHFGHPVTKNHATIRNYRSNLNASVLKNQMACLLQNSCLKIKKARTDRINAIETMEIT